MAAADNLDAAPLVPRDPRKCSHSYEDGTLCKGWKVGETGLCAGHSRLGIAANPSEAASLGAEKRRAKAEERAEARGETLRDKLARRLEAKADVIATRLEAIIADGSDSDALRAMESWLSRVYGRPTEHVETVVKAPETLEELKGWSPEERRAWLADYERRQGPVQLRAVSNE